MSVITITIGQAVECCCAALKNSGTPEDNARITAQALVRAESDGQKGHGSARVPSYAAQARRDGLQIPEPLMAEINQSAQG